MSDTTTITQEERALWRAESRHEYAYFSTDGARLILALDALEQAEAENARLQQRVNDLLSEELTDGAVRERIQLRFNMHEVLQQNERLTKMVDWLANKLIYCPPEFTNCAVDCAECRKEAARRAVAAGEEPCQK